MTVLLTIAILFTLQQPIDATTLVFRLEKDSITVEVGRWKLKSNNAAEMNRFVDMHRKEIDPNKTVVYGDGQAKYESFQSIIQVLKKHDWIKFKFVDTNPTHKPPAKKVETRQT